MEATRALHGECLQPFERRPDPLQAFGDVRVHAVRAGADVFEVLKDVIASSGQCLHVWIQRLVQEPNEEVEDLGSQRLDGLVGLGKPIMLQRVAGLRQGVEAFLLGCGDLETDDVPDAAYCLTGRDAGEVTLLELRPAESAFGDFLRDQAPMLLLQTGFE
ncbi:hypothetical protein [Streptomyces sp. IBSBF 2507]|uniref:hypothetical protein n=1 Tax=Streptomyces sp. IBSBF 2507 TaxID=2903530 RepID=UPI00351E084D